jgi:hypothetical protein
LWRIPGSKGESPLVALTDGVDGVGFAQDRLH